MERGHIAGTCNQRAQSAAELSDMDTRAYMLERLSLDFVTQQQQLKQRSAGDSVSIHNAGMYVIIAPPLVHSMTSNECRH
jgi:hypothetical protein